MPLPEKKQITEDFLVVGEGLADQELIRYLCEDRGIAGYQYVNAGGLDNMEAYVEGLTGLIGFQRLRLLILVADCDDTPDPNFQKVRKSLKKAKGKLPVPENPFQLKREANKPATYVVMLPFTPPDTMHKGCLETLLLESTITHLPIAISSEYTWLG